MKIRARLLTVIPGGERREKQRHVLNLDVSVIANRSGIEASVQDLSTEGLRIETEVSLDIDEIIQVELADDQSIEAQVVWKDGNDYGCRFLAPIEKRLVGTVVLKAPIDEPISGRFTSIEEVPIGQGIDIDVLAQWYSDFEQRRTSSGEQLIGFRQAGNQIIALISRLN